MPRKKTFLDKLTEAVAWFMGSWWGVFFHTIWFTIWLIFNFNVDLLTLWVSLEAIFIGIFLLMASSKAEIQRDKREARAQKRQMEVIKHDVVLDKRADRRQLEMIKMLRGLEKRVKKIEKKVDKKL